MNTKRKGDLLVSKVLTVLLTEGYTVSLSFGDSGY